MVIVALRTVAKPQGPLMDEWITKQLVPVCDGILFSSKNRANPPICDTTDELTLKASC